MKHENVWINKDDTQLPVMHIKCYSTSLTLKKCI